MSEKCSACTPLLVKELKNLLTDGNLIRLMTILYDLTNLGHRQGLLSDDDHDQLSLLVHLVGAAAENKNAKN